MKGSFGWVRVAAVTASLLFLTPTLAADENAKVLAPSGKLRAALYPGTPTSILDAGESDPRGIGYELGRELARRLGVSYEPVVYPKSPSEKNLSQGNRL